MLRPQLLDINKLQQQPVIIVLHFSKFLILSLYESWKLLKELKHLKLADIDTETELSQSSITHGCCASHSAVLHALGADLFVEELQMGSSDLNVDREVNSPPSTVCRVPPDFMCRVVRCLQLQQP